MASNERNRRDSNRRILLKGELQRDNKTYVYRWSDEMGRHSIRADTLEELREKESNLIHDQYYGVSKINMTLSNQVEKYLGIKAGLASSTKENYRYYSNHDIIGSWIGNKKITDIKKSDILRFYREKSCQGYADGTIQILQKIIKPALELAVDDREILRNPAKDCINGYSKKTKEKYALTFSEEREFLDRIDTTPEFKMYAPLFRILLYVGLRISEALGLTWENIDFRKNTIIINHQIQYRCQDGKVKFYASDFLKTENGVREIPMTTKVREALMEQKSQQVKDGGNKSFSIGKYSDFVFASKETGKPYYPDRVRKVLTRISNMNDSRESQLPHISPHILRHTCATRLAEVFDIKTTMLFLGQIDYRTWGSTYDHADKERTMRQIDKLEEFIDSYSA